MAELLMMMADKVGATVAADAMSWKRGQIVTVQDNGWPWCANELGLFHVVKVPTASVDDVAALLAGRAADPAGGTLAQRRAFRFDIDAWITAGKPTLTRAVALGFILPVPKVQDPAVIT